jgi:PAS domain S-box-containing protein
MSLRIRLFILAVVATLPSLVLLVSNQIALLDARYHEIETQVLGLAEQQSAELTQYGEGALQFLAALSQIPIIRDATDPRSCDDELEAIKPNFPQYTALVRSDLNGRTICSSTRVHLDAGDRAYLKRVLETGNFSVGDYVSGKSTRRPTLHFAYPIRSADKLVGVLAVGLDLDWLAHRLGGRQASGTVLNVSDRFGTILLRLPDNEKFQGTKLPDQFQPIIHSSIPGVTQVDGVDGSRQILGYVPIAASPLALHVGVARELGPATADITAAAWRGGGLIALGVLCSFSLAWLWGERSVRAPVAAALEIVRSWRAGNRNLTPRLWPRSEIGLLGVELEDLAAVDAQREEELRLSRAVLDERQAYLSFVLDRVPAGIAQTRPDCTYAYVNRAFANILGRSKDEIIGHKFTEFTHSDDVESDETRFKNALEKREAYTHRKRYIRPDGSVVWCENTVSHLEGSDGILAICIELSERMKHEEQQQRLIDELNHRVKNTLATVQALVAMSKRYTTSTAEFAEAFSGRLQALSLAHNLLTEGVWQSTSLRELIAAELRPYDLARFSIDGPDFDLSPKQAIAFAMIVHELATNAAKYGALSVPPGKVSLRWSLKPQDGCTIGEFDWKEQGGPAVEAPDRHGFGSQLIKSSAQELGGRCTILLEATGLHCMIGFKLQWDKVQMPARQQ